MEDRAAFLEEQLAEKEDKRNQLCDDITMARETFGEAENELGRLRFEMRSKSEELEKIKARSNLEA